MIRAAVVEGIATATEVATVGVAYTFVVGLLFYRRFEWNRLYPILVEHGVAVGRDPDHHRLRDGDGLGAHAVGLLARNSPR